MKKFDTSKPECQNVSLIPKNYSVKDPDSDLGDAGGEETVADYFRNKSRSGAKKTAKKTRKR